MVGNHTDAYYLSDTLNNVRSEIQNRFNTETDIYVAFVELSNERVNESCGIAQYDGGPVMIPASGDCVQGEAGVDLIAHELGHAFNLCMIFGLMIISCPMAQDETGSRNVPLNSWTFHPIQ